MTPKEKAEELVNKYFRYSNHYAAKQCALIAVDEILSINNERWYQLTGSKENYYKEVKTEIEKL